MLNRSRRTGSRGLASRGVGIFPMPGSTVASRCTYLPRRAALRHPMTSPDDIEIRDFATQDDYRACVALQRETWGADFTDVVPPSILKVAQQIGGVAAGAFDRTGAMQGFVFGLTGLRRGKMVHWSDMLAVRPEARDRHVGRRLKEHQRQRMESLGVDQILWTYDPLIARNAHLNFVVFGVRAVEYVRDMYGETGSALHRGLPTDRFVVAWPTSQGEIDARVAKAAGAARDPRWRTSPVVTGDPERGTEPVDAIDREELVRVAVPHDAAALFASDSAQAAAWRATTRQALEHALAAGYDVVGFTRAPADRRGYYLLQRVR